MERRRDDDSLFRLDVGRADHFAPLFGFLLKPPRVIRGRAAGDAAAQVGKPQLQFGVRQRGVNLLVQFVDDLRGRVFGRADTYPCSRIVPGTNSLNGGTSGRTSERVGVVTANARTLPVLMYSTVEATNITCTWPLMRSVSAGWAPR